MKADRQEDRLTRAGEYEARSSRGQPIPLSDALLLSDTHMGNFYSGVFFTRIPLTYIRAQCVCVYNSLNTHTQTHTQEHIHNYHADDFAQKVCCWSELIHMQLQFAQQQLEMCVCV